ncbi:hypothetical protein HPB51_022285 [Rhipicephalus microplus]|uniref:Uncharacterized protein n=1 Tax=Rhipicephalus microplus TaxID=6941 RepID=A0A9J6DJY2_RHIMP|nr:hypothetical protein HPB51_022285 [Rhipicephalus microplus]
MDAPTSGPNSDLKSRNSSHSSRRASNRCKSSCSSSSKSSRRGSDHQKVASSSGTGSYLDGATPANAQVSAAPSPAPEKVASMATLTPAPVQPSAYVTADTSVSVKEQTRAQMTNSCTPYEEVATEPQEPVGRFIRPRTSHTSPLASEHSHAVQQDHVPLADVKQRRQSTFRRFRDVGRVVRSSFTSSLLDTPAVFGSSVLRRFSMHSSVQDRLKVLNAASSAKAEMEKVGSIEEVIFMSLRTQYSNYRSVFIKMKHFLGMDLIVAVAIAIGTAT